MLQYLIVCPLVFLAGLDARSASAQTKVINLSSNIAALVTFIATGNVCYPLGLSQASVPSRDTISGQAWWPTTDRRWSVSWS